MSFNNNFGTDGYGPQESTYQVNKFPQYTVPYSGPSSSVYHSASIYYNKGWQVKVTQGNPYQMVATLQCELSSDGITPITGTGSYVTVNWGLHYKTTDKDILNVGTNIIPWIGQIETSDRILLANAINSPPKNGILDFTTFSTNSLSVSSSQTIWYMVQSGFKTVPIVTPILRMTLVVPSTYNMTSFNNYIGSNYSVSTLASAIGIPSNWSSIMPQGTDPNPTGSNGIPYLYGWLKQPPTQDQNGTTITIQQEWEYGLWPQNIYGTRL